MAASISYRKNTLSFENKLSSLDELTKILTKEAEGAGTKAMHTAEDMLEARNADSGMPYGPQSVRELGCVGMDYGWVSGTFLTEALAYDVQARACGRERSWDFYQGQWDGGKLMRAFRQWVNTEKTQKIIFVYGSNDPWTGGAIDAAAAESNPSIAFILEPGGFHTDYFLNTDYYSTETFQLIQKTIKAFL